MSVIPKIFLGEGLVTFFLLSMAFVACDRILAVVMVVLAWTINGFSAAGQHVNHLDIAPVYAGHQCFIMYPLMSMCAL